ncbi:puromycin sensitive aminopeptidase [Echinococcus multilocularis]|uniref:Aminopeptidase n=1 Tax=Echinococcus multilocularis TaxID=6211 RepID=A0A068YFD9_ECHMU|nr:puromycin sensitive aminopeptidase [Echinococcus multilocularis]
MSSTNSEFERLPRIYEPQVYILELYPNARDFTFCGKVTICMALTQPTNSIVLNAKKIEIVSARVSNSALKSELIAPTKSIVYDEKQEKVTINFDSKLEKGDVALCLEYKGILADDMHGFYRSTYRDSSGEERVILSTQFEATYARRAFPCFDEPDRKAKFRISMVIPDHLTALSCMPEVSRNPVETCELQKYGLPTATSHPYVKVFGTGFPLPKLDLVAIPDFEMGAMENWGLLTYRETRLLVDEAGSSLMSKRGVALTVAHEVAHMWFGNLVTMKWWTHLWLNEGFATWIEYLAVDHCFPEYDIWTVFLTDVISNAVATDALKTSHPIEVEVHSPDEVAEIFDAVSYEKGSSIIRMINDYVGPEKFMKGLQLYIQRHKYGNTTTDDLWNALSEVCGEDVGSIMSTWTRQTGFPALTVHKVCDTAEDGLVISIQQDRFLAEGGYSDDTSEWYVPVTICEAADSTKILKRVLVPPSARTQAFSVHLPSGSRIRLNPGVVGFYRVQYEGSLMGPILEALGERRLENRDRVCVLADAFALARAGRIRMTSALTMASTLRCEGDYIVWCELRTELGKLRSLLQERCATSNDAAGVEATTPFEEALNTFIIHLAEPPFKQLGWEAGKEESNNATLLRPLLIAMLGAAGAPEVVARATTLFDRHYKAVMSCDKGDADGCGAATACGDIIPADLRVAVYSTCMRHGGDGVYERLLNLHERATMHDERVRILHCVGCTGQSALAKRVIGLAFSDLVRKQDRLFPLMSLSSGSAIGRRAVWREIQRRIDTLMEDLAATSIVSHVISTCCKGFCSKADYEEVEAFFKAHPVQCVRAVQQALESISLNTRFMDRDGDSVSQFLVQFARNIPGCGC